MSEGKSAMRDENGMSVPQSSRREMLGFGAALMGSSLIGTQALAAPAASARWRRSIIVNALGGLGNPNPGGDMERIGRSEGRPRIFLDKRSLSDAHASGLTAVNVTIGYSSETFGPFEEAVSGIANYDQMIRAFPADLTKILSVADILRAKRERKVGIIYGFQNGVPVGKDLTRVDILADLGVRVIQLTYNPANDYGDGSMAKENRGLTELGRALVDRLNQNRVMVDLSHSGEKTCLEAARVSKQPISISHTGCRAITDLPRNKTDAELRLVAERGGFVGIYFMPFLDLSGSVKARHVVAHIEHAIKICGEDHVGIGTDGSVTQIDDLEAYEAELAKEVAARKAAGIGATGGGPKTYPFAVDLRGTNQFFKLADLLRERGHSVARIEKILGGNYLAHGRRVWGG